MKCANEFILFLIWRSKLNNRNNLNAVIIIINIFSELLLKLQKYLNIFYINIFYRFIL